MSNASQPIIDKALAKLREQEAEVFRTKRFINQVCAFDGAPLMFPDLTEGDDVSVPGQSSKLPPDAYTGKPLATAVKMILEDRKRRLPHGPATLEELHKQLLEGGFDFQSKDEANQKSGLGVSLAKNNISFRKLPNGMWGLAEWYGGAAPRSKKRNADNSSPSAQQPESEGAEEAAANQNVEEDK